MVRSPRPQPLFDIHPLTGATIEVFYADGRLETFGRYGAGWFWCYRRRGFPPDGLAAGPFATSYAAYRDAMTSQQLNKHTLSWALASTGISTPEQSKHS